jgi:hypothetical protein
MNVIDSGNQVPLREAGSLRDRSRTRPRTERMGPDDRIGFYGLQGCNLPVKNRHGYRKVAWWVGQSGKGSKRRIG